MQYFLTYLKYEKSESARNIVLPKVGIPYGLQSAQVLQCPSECRVLFVSSGAAPWLSSNHS